MKRWYCDLCHQEIGGNTGLVNYGREDYTRQFQNVAVSLHAWRVDSTVEDVLELCRDCLFRVLEFGEKLTKATVRESRTVQPTEAELASIAKELNIEAEIHETFDLYQQRARGAEKEKVR